MWVSCAGYLRRPDRILRSGSPLVVMMQTSQNRNAPQSRQWWNDRRGRMGWDWNLPVDALMGTCMVEVPDIVLDLAAQMAFTQNQDVIQQFTPDATNASFADCIGGFPWRMDHSKACAGYFRCPRRILLSSSPLGVVMQASQNRNASEPRQWGDGCRVIFAYS
jgi:hypothetical protein